MSLLLGFYSDRWQAVHLQLVERLTQQYPQAQVFNDGRCFMLCDSQQHWGSPDWLQHEASVLYCFGHPLLSADRHKDLTKLNRRDFEPQLLDDAQGSFLLAHYNRHQQRLTLCSDALSLRPFYTGEYHDAMVFANRMGPLVDLLGVAERNQDAQLEYALLGYTLGSHTPYRGIRASLPGEMVSISSNDIRFSRYRHWHYQQPQPLTEGIEQLASAFRQSCKRYLGEDRHFVSTLSGGLDSRVIASELLRQGKTLHCLNFSRQMTQDLWCAQQFADRHRLPLTTIEVDDTQAQTVEQRLGQHWCPQRFADFHQVERPRLVWSGNGGSVCVGQIYTSQPLLNAIKNEDAEQVIDAYLAQQQAYVPQALVADGVNAQLRFKERLMKSLNNYQHLPMSKAWQLFLWENDQHQHVAIPFEQMGEFQLDFYLPFYAQGVLNAMLSMPMESAARHGIYMRWVQDYYPQMLSTPWQTYPDHLPCPLPKPKTLQHQWQLARPSGSRNRLWRKSWQTILSRHSPLKRGAIAARCMADLLKLRDTSAQLHFVDQFERW